MPAQVGTDPFTSEESDKSEKTLQEIQASVLAEEEFKDFSLTKSYSVNELYESSIATTKTRGDSMTEPDLRVLCYREKVVGLGDNKFQNTNQNACERLGLYSMDIQKFNLPSKRVFVVLDGPGFECYNQEGHVSGATGKMIVRATEHFTTLVNPTKPEIENTYREYLRRIVRGENP